MSRDIKLGLLYAAVSCAIYAVVFAAIYFGREYNIKTYPRFLLPIATLAPLFLASFFVTGMINQKPEPLSRKEYITFALITIIGVAISSTLAEAHFLYSGLKDLYDLSFTDVLFAPLDRRYTVTVLFGMGFATSATVVAAYVALVRIPATIKVRLHRTHSDADLA